MSLNLAATNEDPSRPGVSEGFFFAKPDERSAPLSLFEDNLQLGPQASDRRQVEHVQSGTYFAAGDVVYFSSSDGTNPRNNGRRYWFRNTLEPRIAPLPLTVLGVIWLLGVASLVVASRHRRLLVDRFVDSPLPDRSVALLAGLVLLISSTVCINLFSGLDHYRTTRFQLGFAGLALLILLLLRHRPVWRGWMLWPLSFAVWCTARLATDPNATGSWEDLGRLWLSLALGFLVISAWDRTGPTLGTAGLTPLAGFFALFAVVITLQNLGFDWNGLLAHFAGLSWPEEYVSTWATKFTESWVLVLTWSLVAAGVAQAGSSGRRVAWIVGAGGAMVLFTGYSKTGLVVFLFAVGVFLCGLRQPSVVRRIAMLTMFVLILGAPLLGSLAWGFYLNHEQELSARPSLKDHLVPRLITWGYAANMAQQHPLLGWGIGTAARSPARERPAIEIWDQASKLPPGRQARKLLPGGHPHNAPLLLWIDTGGVGIGCLLGLVWTALGRSRRSLDPALASAHLTLVVSTFLVFWFNYPLLSPAPIFLLVAAAGTSAIATSSRCDR
jgi:hypothetical protein